MSITIIISYGYRDDFLMRYVMRFLAQRQLQPGHGRRWISQTERHQRRVAGVAQGKERPDQFAPGTYIFLTRKRKFTNA